MATETPLHPAMVQSLEKNRESFNQRFLVANLNRSNCDSAVFFQHLRTRVSPIIAAIHRDYPERVEFAVNELYDVSLDLFRTGYFGNEDRVPELDVLWRNVLPTMPHLMAKDPRRIAGALSNALIRLAAAPSLRADAWLELISNIGSICQSSNELIDASAVVAWQCGMAQLRRAALERLRNLPQRVAAQCLNIQRVIDGTSWNELITQLEGDVWFDPSESLKTESAKSVCIAHRVSGHRGFGGHMLRPPTVVARNGAIVISDSISTWRLYADCFGWHLHRLEDHEVASPLSTASSKSNSNVRIDASGHVRWATESAQFPHLAHSASQAFDGATLAVTLPTSCQVFLLARRTYRTEAKK